MVIKKIEIEGFHNVEKKAYEFNMLNYLKGPNGSGKSTVLEAIQLALLGYIPGTDKNKSSIFSHARGRALAVTLYLDDEGEEISVSRVFCGTPSNVTSSLDISPKNYDLKGVIGSMELPIFNFNEFLGMTSNKLKDWFLNFLPKSDVTVDWEDELKNSLSESGIMEVQEDFIQENINHVQNLQGVEGIRTANKYFKELLSFKKSELQRVEGTIKSQIYYEDVSGGDEDISECKSEIYALQNLRKIQIERESIEKTNKHIYESLKSFSELEDSLHSDENYSKLVEEKEKLVEEKEKYEKEFEEINRKLIDVTVSWRTLNELSKSGTMCPILSIDCSDLKSRKQKIDKDLKNKLEEKEEIEQKKEYIETNISDIQLKLDDIVSTLSEIESAYQRRDSLKSQIRSVPEISDSRNSEELEKEISELNNKLIKLEANKEYNRLIEKITLDKYHLDQEVQAVKCWEKLTGVNGLQNQTEDGSPFDILSDNMNKYVHKFFNKTVNVYFNLVGKANSFSFGLMRQNKYIPYNLLSSGEKCLYALALMLSLINIGDSRIRLILVDDMFDHLDNKNIENIFKNLQKIKDVQMIFAGVKDIKGKEFTIEIRG